MYVNGSVTTPVEASPKEARHTSIETCASGMASSFPCPVSDSYTQLKLEPKQ